jgi:hypothetical protein
MTLRNSGKVLRALSAVLCAHAGLTAADISTGQLRGITVARGGVPLAEVGVVVRSMDGNADHRAISGPKGQFAIDGLAPGVYQLTGLKRGFTPSTPVTLQVAQNQAATAEIVLTPEAADEAPLTLRERQMLDRIEQLEGRLAALAPALANRAEPGAAGPAKDPAPPASGSLHGFIGASTGAPLADVHVVIRGLSNASEQTVSSDSKGTFVAEGLPPGPYQLLAFKEGFASPTTAVEIAPNQVARPALAMQPEEAAEVSTPASPKIDPFSDRDATWANGNTRTHSSPLDSKYFTGEFRADIHFGQDFNQPKDNSMGGSSEIFRNGEVQVEQLSLGGDLHVNNVRGRILTMFGMFATTTPRNDPSIYKGQWQLDNVYRYISEAYGGYHINKLYGINIDAGIFVSYVGLFSYYNHDNWAYQPSYVSSNTPWFFNGVRLQFFVTPHLKIEPWIVNGWQAYARPNGRPGLGGQIRWQPKDWLILVANQYGLGEDTPGVKGRERLHTDDSVEVRYFNRPQKVGNGIDKMAFSFTGDLGCETGGGVTCHGGKLGPKQSFLGWMVYNRIWWHHDLFAWTLGGGGMNNNGRYLTLTPPINGATAGTGTPYFTQNPGDRFRAWDTTSTWDYMPRDFLTFRLEFGYRHSNVPYWTGRGGITPPGGNNGSPGQFVCMDGTPTPDPSGCGTVGLWRPDLRRGQALLLGAIMVKF